MSIDEFWNWCAHMTQVALKAGFDVAQDTVAIHAGSFYCWAQDEITLQRLVTIVNAASGGKMTAVTADPSTEGHRE
jgi:hypothetical protein